MHSLAGARPLAVSGAASPARQMLLAAGVLLASAVVLRSAWFGNPLGGYDEQLYLLIGDRMLHGSLLYVDIWDRKPPGLFLIYAAIRLLGGDGVLQYQLVATGFAAATAFVILRIVHRHYSLSTGLACGLLYLLWIGVMGGEAGQAPVFYNLPVAVAALLVLDAFPAMGTRRGFVRASAAMALFGVAIFIKTTAVFEGCFFGLVVMLGCIRAGYRLPRLAAAALWFMLLGVLPFALAGLAYWSMGHFEAFWFANARSAMLRPGFPFAETSAYLIRTLLALTPAALLAALSLRSSLDAPALPAWEARLLAGWLAAAALAFAAVGYFDQHYALPMLLPLTIAGARFVQGWPHRRFMLILLAAYPLFHQLALSRYLMRDDRADVAAIVSAIPQRVTSECMFVFGAPAVLYHLSNACLVTPYAFADHLFRGDEAAAIGADPVAATRAALARRPAVIAIDERSFPRFSNRAAIAEVERALARDYRPSFAHRYSYFADSTHRVVLWERR